MQASVAVFFDKRICYGRSRVGERMSDEFAAEEI